MTKDMTTGNPLKLILFFSLPVLFGNLFQQFYSMVDTIIVGQFLGEDALAAVGATGSIMFLVLGFASGLAQGFGVMVSQAFGAKDESRLKHIVALSFLLTIIISVILTALTVTTSRELLIFMNTPDNILDMADSYIRVIFWGIITSMMYNVVSGILRGVGDSKTPLYFLLFSSALNIVLDLFCIVTLKLNVAGAAYATVISQGISAVLCLIYMYRKFTILRTRKSDYYIDRVTTAQMMGLGIPMALNYSLIAVGSMILQSAVNVFGSSAVAAFTAASKVEQISTQPMPALGTTMSTYCGQNLGAGKYERIFDGMKKAFGIALGTVAIAAFICTVFGRSIVSLFLSEPTEAIYSYATQYLNTISCFFFFLALIYLYRTSLQGLGKGIMPMVSGIFEMICRVGVVWLLLNPYGYWSVRLASPVAWIGAGVPLMISYLVWKNRKKKQLCSQAVYNPVPAMLQQNRSPILNNQTMGLLLYLLLISYSSLCNRISALGTKLISSYKRSTTFTAYRLYWLLWLYWLALELPLLWRHWLSLELSLLLWRHWLSLELSLLWWHISIHILLWHSLISVHHFLSD